MKAAVLYSGGKDSSFMAVMLKRLGLDVELCTANFGVYDSYVPASKSAESLGFTHKVLDLDFEILDKTCDMIMNDGFPNDGIKFIHETVIEEVAEGYDIIADCLNNGTVDGIKCSDCAIRPRVCRWSVEK